MENMEDFEFDTIGFWSEHKLDVLRKYCEAYSKILNKQKWLSYGFIDGFAGEGFHKSRKSSQLVPGSPMIAFLNETPFQELHLIDINEKKINQLKKLTKGGENLKFYHGDSNRILMEEVFPSFRFEDYKRAFCFLDPYGMSLNWEVIKTAGELKTIDLLLNFPTMDIKRNIFLKDINKIRESDEDRLNLLWGDKSWKEIAFKGRNNLFQDEDPIIERASDATKKLISAFKERLKKVGGFEYVVEPLPLKNSIGIEIYHLFFGSPKEAGAKIARDVFRTYRGDVKK